MHPPAYFYATVPRAKENPVDYWIRLNKAADLADKELHRQGKHLNDMGEEVTRMFIKFCPDPSLANIFRCKPIREWSAKEIQGRIDDYQREFRSRENVSVNLRSHTSTVFKGEHNMYDCPVAVSPAPQIQPFHALPDAEVCHQLEPTLTQSLVQQSRPCTSPPTVSSQHGQQVESQLLTRMMEMMEQLMDRVQSRDDSNSRRGPRQQRGFIRRPAESVMTTNTLQ